MCECICHDILVKEIRGQLSGGKCFLLPCGPKQSNTGHQVWSQAPLPAETSGSSSSFYFYQIWCFFFLFPLFSSFFMPLNKSTSFSEYQELHLGNRIPYLQKRAHYVVPVFQYDELFFIQEGNHVADMLHLSAVRCCNHGGSRWQKYSTHGRDLKEARVPVCPLRLPSPMTEWTLSTSENFYNFSNTLWIGDHTFKMWALKDI